MSAFLSTLWRYAEALPYAEALVGMVVVFWEPD